IRLSVRFRRFVDCDTAGRRCRCAVALRSRAIFGESALHRRAAQRQLTMQRSGALARQLAFDLPHAESFRRDDFLASAANEAALSLVDRWPDWPGRFAAISGPRGAGKSHLAAIWAERAGARIVAAPTLLREGVPAALVTGALVVEDVAPGMDEAALFHLL